MATLKEELETLYHSNECISAYSKVKGVILNAILEGHDSADFTEVLTLDAVDGSNMHPIIATRLVEQGFTVNRYQGMYCVTGWNKLSSSVVA